MQVCKDIAYPSGMLLWGSVDDDWVVVVPSIAAIAGSMSTILLTNYY